MPYRLARFEGYLLLEGDELFLVGASSVHDQRERVILAAAYKLVLDPPRIVDSDRRVVAVLNRPVRFGGGYLGPGSGGLAASFETGVIVAQVSMQNVDLPTWRG